MKIAFLGTGHGIATPERYCSAALIKVAGAVSFGGGNAVPRAEKGYFHYLIPPLFLHFDFYV